MDSDSELLSAFFCSMFVLLKGATKEQAFKIGNEIADAVTATNPKPVKLKFEKVMLPHRTHHINTQTHTLSEMSVNFDLDLFQSVPIFVLLLHA